MPRFICGRNSFDGNAPAKNVSWSFSRFAVFLLFLQPIVLVTTPKKNDGWVGGVWVVWNGSVGAAGPVGRTGVLRVLGWRGRVRLALPDAQLKPTGCCTLVCCCHPGCVG